MGRTCSCAGGVITGRLASGSGATGPLSGGGALGGEHVKIL